MQMRRVGRCGASEGGHVGKWARRQVGTSAGGGGGRWGAGRRSREASFTYSLDSALRSSTIKKVDRLEPSGELRSGVIIVIKA